MRVDTGKWPEGLVFDVKIGNKASKNTKKHMKMANSINLFSFLYFYLSYEM